MAKERQTRQQYFDAALGTLATAGAAELKIGPLCRGLGVTSGSFYHHFGSWAGFVEALLEHWETEQTRRVFELTRALGDPWERVETLEKLATTVPHEAEAAIRAWSKADPAVAAAQRRVDELRLDGLAEVITGVGADDATARRLAVLGIAVLVGIQQLRTPVDRAELAAVLADFERVIAANVPPRGGG